jgi:hypothetical protein
MGAFCIFGISRTNCRRVAERKVPTMEGKRALSIEEWAGRVVTMAAELFETTDKRVKVSPELDAPQFCQDWINAQPDEVRQAVIMVRGPKVDKNGGAVTRNGTPVMTWLEWDESKAPARPFGE